MSVLNGRHDAVDHDIPRGNESYSFDEVASVENGWHRASSQISC